MIDVSDDVGLVSSSPAEPRDDDTKSAVSMSVFEEDCAPLMAWEVEANRREFSWFDGKGGKDVLSIKLGALASGVERERVEAGKFVKSSSSDVCRTGARLSVSKICRITSFLYPPSLRSFWINREFNSETFNLSSSMYRVIKSPASSAAERPSSWTVDLATSSGLFPDVLR